MLQVESQINPLGVYLRRGHVGTLKYHSNEENPMRQLWTIPVLGLAVTSLLAITDKPAIAANLFQSTLSGSQEVPTPVNTPGTGSATLEITGAPGSWVLDYEVTYSNLLGVIAAPFGHIHNAPFGQNGAIVHDLDGANVAPIAGSTAGTIIGDWRFDDPEDPLTDILAQELFRGNLYFNLHTDQFPSGEIRGQITAVPEPSSLMGLALAGSVGLLLARRKLSN